MEPDIFIAPDDIGEIVLRVDCGAVRVKDGNRHVWELPDGRRLIMFHDFHQIRGRRPRKLYLGPRWEDCAREPTEWALLMADRGFDIRFYEELKIAGR